MTVEQLADQIASFCERSLGRKDKPINRKNVVSIIERAGFSEAYPNLGSEGTVIGVDVAGGPDWTGGLVKRSTADKERLEKMAREADEAGERLKMDMESPD